ncbi:hypothetical protein IID22_04970 [Patescibacteria group bacterium]|nr:hypothetical protein [Patescibacteria group bacterium]
MERFLNIFSRLKRGEERAGRQVGIGFFDLRGMTDEERMGFEPGFYFKIGPIPEAQTQKEDFLYSLIPHFHTMIADQGFSEGEYKPIPPDGKFGIGPTWRFTEDYFDEESSTFIVKAEPLSKKVLEKIPVDTERKQALATISVSF